MTNNEGDLIAELLTITGELGGDMKRSTTYSSSGRSSKKITIEYDVQHKDCLLYTSPSPRDKRQSRMPSSA